MFVTNIIMPTTTPNIRSTPIGQTSLACSALNDIDAQFAHLLESDTPARPMKSQQTQQQQSQQNNKPQSIQKEPESQIQSQQLQNQTPNTESRLAKHSILLAHLQSPTKASPLSNEQQVDLVLLANAAIAHQTTTIVTTNSNTATNSKITIGANHSQEKPAAITTVNSVNTPITTNSIPVVSAVQPANPMNTTNSTNSSNSKANASFIVEDDDDDKDSSSDSDSSSFNQENRDPIDAEGNSLTANQQSNPHIGKCLDVIFVFSFLYLFIFRLLF